MFKTDKCPQCVSLNEIWSNKRKSPNPWKRHGSSSLVADKLFCNSLITSKVQKGNILPQQIDSSRYPPPPPRFSPPSSTCTLTRAHRQVHSSTCGKAKEINNNKSKHGEYVLFKFINYNLIPRTNLQQNACLQ